MSVTIFAVDPGLNGAYAVCRDGKITAAGDLPRFNKVLDGGTLAGMIKYSHVDVCVIEKVASRPGQGVSSVFTFGCAYGVCIGIFMALGLPYEQVAPGVWKKRFKLGQDKEQSRQRASELHPEARHFLTRKLDHNRAEAILLARYWSEV